jgi:hypothetical protein
MLVIRVEREPAEKTSTSPLGIALAELEGEELAADELAAEELAAVEEELLQPVATSPMHAIDTSAASCAPRR